MTTFDFRSCILTLAMVACNTSASSDLDVGQDGAVVAGTDASACSATCGSQMPDTCVDSMTLRSYEATGKCTGTECTYSHHDVACDNGCANGVCLGICDVTLCDQPPPPTCVSGTMVRTYEKIGTCKFGNCSYASSSDTFCPRGCLAGACLTGTSVVTSVSCGFDHTCAVVDGAVRCWGSGSSGQLGNGVGSVSSPPVAATGLGAGATVVSVGSYESCAVVGGAARCWGKNTNGELGIGMISTWSPSPTDVVALGSGVVGIGAGTSRTCAIVNGGVKCWGLNASGELGFGYPMSGAVPTPGDAIAPGAGVTAIAVGYDFSCAIVNGGARCWGDDTYEQLGNGTGGDYKFSTVPVDVVGLGANVTALSTGLGPQVCAVVGGAAKCWGRNANGELGNGTQTLSATPVDVSGLSAHVTAIAMGGTFACAVVDGAVSCWGLGENGQLGNGTGTSGMLLHPNRALTPVASVGLGSEAVSVAAGWGHACAVLASGALLCWGSNLYGEADPTSVGTDVLVPTPIMLP